MKLIKYALITIVAAFLFAPAALWAAKPTPELCPCWYENEDNGIWGAIADINYDVALARYTEFDVIPEDFEVVFNVVEGSLPDLYCPDLSICEEMWVTTKWQPSLQIYYCSVRIYDRDTFLRDPVEEPLFSELEYKSCVSATKLLRKTARDYRVQ